MNGEEGECAAGCMRVPGQGLSGSLPVIGARADKWCAMAAVRSRGVSPANQGRGAPPMCGSMAPRAPPGPAPPMEGRCAGTRMTLPGPPMGASVACDPRPAATAAAAALMGGTRLKGGSRPPAPMKGMWGWKGRASPSSSSPSPSGSLPPQLSLSRSSPSRSSRSPRSLPLSLSLSPLSLSLSLRPPPYPSLSRSSSLASSSRRWRSAAARPDDSKSDEILKESRPWPPLGLRASPWRTWAWACRASSRLRSSGEPARAGRAGAGEASRLSAPPPHRSSCWRSSADMAVILATLSLSLSPWQPLTPV
ncbi:hypothetical protein E2C01_058079 [Portunus trituberculatus]|uniref:Uncharacterized protein n=1 Tax=Portunus trituberculatus TaxID=210409 RepID=A0A5B7GUM8_PORTR|nr:hypothetical protein [Portunus trituberculatus]